MPILDIKVISYLTNLIEIISGVHSDINPIFVDEDYDAKLSLRNSI